MYITSTINPLTKSNNDIPVVLLCYEETRKFILRPKDYTDLVRITQENFDLGPNTVPTFQTSTLDICRGKNVEIDEGAYALMSEFLDEITVVSKERVRGRESPQPEREWAPQTLQMPVTTPPAQKRDVEKEEAETDQIEDIAKLDIRTRQVVASGSVERQKQRPQEEKIDEEEVEAAVTFIQQSVSFAEEHLSKKTRITSGYIKRKVWTQAEEEEEEEGQQLNIGGVWPGIENSAEIPVEESRVPHKATDDRLRVSPVNAKQEIPLVSGRSANAAKNNERFNVMIYGPRGDQEAAFKTRGQHAVKKVLAGACKTFNVNFEGASLAIITQTLDEDGEVVQHTAKCDNDATIAESGIDEHTFLTVVPPDSARQERESDDE